MRRTLGLFHGTIAGDDAKKSLSSQTNSLLENHQGNKIGEEPIYVEASRIKRDLLQYNAWGDSTVTPVSWGGHYSYGEILDKLNPIITLLEPKYKQSPVTQRVIAAPVHPPIAAPGTTATPSTHPDAGPSPGPASSLGKTKIMIIAAVGLSGLLGVLLLLRK